MGWQEEEQLMAEFNAFEDWYRASFEYRNGVRWINLPKGPNFWRRQFFSFSFRYGAPVGDQHGD